MLRHVFSICEDPPTDFAQTIRGPHYKQMGGNTGRKTQFTRTQTTAGRNKLRREKNYNEPRRIQHFIPMQ